MKNTALVIVDMQRYYLEEDSDFYRFSEQRYPGCMEYIKKRSSEIVTPNIQKLQAFFRENNAPIIYLRLCGKKQDRSDLHRFFYDANNQGAVNGFPAVYPLQNEVMSEVIPALKPQKEELVFCKTTFSAFNSTDIAEVLKERKIQSLVMCGLATSQCVETTARDASEQNFEIIMIEDAQADYDDVTHRASLFSSRGVCGGVIYNTEDFIKNHPF